MEILQGDRQVAGICKDKGNTAGGCPQKFKLRKTGDSFDLYTFNFHAYGRVLQPYLWRKSMEGRP